MSAASHPACCHYSARQAYDDALWVIEDPLTAAVVRECIALVISRLPNADSSVDELKEGVRKHFCGAILESLLDFLTQIKNTAQRLS